MELFLTLLSGIGWTLVYIDSIRKGFRDKTYAIPSDIPQALLPPLCGWAVPDGDGLRIPPLSCQAAAERMLCYRLFSGGRM